MLLTIIILSLLVLGCSHKNIISKKWQNETFEEINQMSKRTTSTIITDDGDILKTQYLYLSQDVAIFVNSENGRENIIPIIKINEIIVKQKREGAKEGMRIGFILGSFVGFSIGYSQGTDNEGFVRWTASQKGVVYSIAFGLIGAFVGTPIGGEIGHKERFIFRD